MSIQVGVISPNHIIFSSQHKQDAHESDALLSTNASHSLLCLWCAWAVVRCLYHNEMYAFYLFDNSLWNTMGGATSTLHVIAICLYNVPTVMMYSYIFTIKCTRTFVNHVCQFHLTWNRVFCYVRLFRVVISRVFMLSYHWFVLVWFSRFRGGSFLEPTPTI